MHEGGAQTSAELGARTGTHERYAREWLEHQATAQILAVDDAEKAAGERRYSLPEGYEEVFVNPLSMAYIAPLGRFLKVMGAVAEPLLDVYRSGGGLSWGAMGEDARMGQAAFNRPFFINSLVAHYLKQLPELDAALSSPGARVAEIGPGGGWALIAMAEGYPGPGRRRLRPRPGVGGDGERQPRPGGRR